MEDLTKYDIIPNSKRNYLANYGPHFTKELLTFALSKMYKLDKSGKKVKLEPYTKTEVDSILETFNVHLKNNQLYDYVYVANMCKADFLHSSIIDEEHLAKYVKDVIDDDDAYDGIVFNRWIADMARKGIAIDWEEMI